MIAESVAHLENVRIVSISTLLVNVAATSNATAIVKGLRAVSDFESELQMAQMNRSLSGVETLFLPSSSHHSFIASRLLREVARYGGDVSSFVPGRGRQTPGRKVPRGSRMTTFDGYEDPRSTRSRAPATCAATSRRTCATSSRSSPTPSRCHSRTPR